MTNLGLNFGVFNKGVLLVDVSTTGVSTVSQFTDLIGF
jgi:hypothetical protein